MGDIVEPEKTPTAGPIRPAISPWLIGFAGVIALGLTLLRLSFTRHWMVW